MESTDVIAAKKRVKEQKNMHVRSEQPPRDKSYRKLRELFLKTEEMREMSHYKNQQMEEQFQELQTRLSTSTGFLNQIKKSIENIKFSYERDITDLEKVTAENRDDIDRQIEEIRKNIGNLRSKASADKPKAQTYQEAFSDVLAAFQSVAHKSE